MKQEAWIGKKGLRYWFYKYRDSEYYSVVVIGVTIVAGLALLISVIIPQLNEWFSIRQQVVEATERITTLESNINFINNLDRGRLRNQLDTASAALPPDKNFGAMLTVISNAAANTNVSLGDYSFQVGSVASSSGIQADTKIPGINSNRITVVVVGTLTNAQRFIGALEESLPLSEVVAVDGSGPNISITIDFYQKPYPDITIPDTELLTPLSDEKTVLLQKISRWNKPALPNSERPSNGDIPLF